MLKKDTGKPSIIRKDVFIVLVLLFDALAWYYMTPMMIKNILSVLGIAAYEQELIIWSAYSLAIIGSGIVGSILLKKISRLNLLYLWTILGVIASLLPALLNDFTRVHVLIISILFGISFGLGMPSCLAYFADYTFIENRGRTGGIILLITNLSAPLLAIVFSMFNLVVNSIIFASWRALGLIVFLLKPEESVASETKKNPSFMSVFRDKSFILYFVAWLMFCFIDRFEWPILSDFFDEFQQNLLFMISPLIVSFSAFIAGHLSDWIGRKRMVLYGFVTLGIAYAIIGIAPKEPISPYFYLAVNSIAIGILWVNFLFVLWGDLSQSGTREKYYIIGVTPFFLTDIVQLLSAQFVLKNILETSAFSLASFFLFLAVLPLLYAPETLPERKIELRQLRKYVEAARKVKEKYEEKGAKG